jgi:hypothetical protein
MICTRSAGSIACQTPARTQPAAFPRAQVSYTLLRVPSNAVLLITNSIAAHMQVSWPSQQCSQRCSSFAGSVRRLQSCGTHSPRRLTGVTCLASRCKAGGHTVLGIMAKAASMSFVWSQPQQHMLTPAFKWRLGASASRWYALSGLAMRSGIWVQR